MLQEWCEQWAIKVNVKKCGVMHIRKKEIKKTLKEFYVDGERIDVVEKYKYLGCTVNEHLECKGMIEERAMAGTRALSSWLRNCRAMVREVRGTTFRKLMEALVKTVLLYGSQKCGEVVEYWSRWNRCRCERHGYSWGWEDITPGCPCSLRCRWSR